jgi:hypothetical protein
MDSARIQLAKRVLETLAQGDTVSFDDAIQLRNWAVRPEDSLLSLAEIARAILDREENRDAKAAKGGR